MAEFEYARLLVLTETRIGVSSLGLVGHDGLYSTQDPADVSTT